ncbi:glycoside hydrolase family 65 protein [Ilumatobacter coccineus]|uniref:glycoside hydrolase family 65 protein n=1 Tax=Ilumatobacter coccineus TaxID=467094 RepID=UPI0009FEEC8B|nr:glycosyl hydrolase family 65 protein [Ilumatobacter coccineus]
MDTTQRHRTPMPAPADQVSPNHQPPPTGLASHRFPLDPWRLVETEHSADDLGYTETLFGVGNGYLGMRANPEEGRDAHTHGTYINGFHETWEIQHAENAFGFAKVGQTIVNVPDAKLIKLYVDDEPFIVSQADLDSYERSIDFRTGVLERNIVWRTPGGKRVRIRSTRMVSMAERHLAVMTFEVTMLDATAPVVISSQLLNRQDGVDEYHVPDASLGEGEEQHDPRQARQFDHRVLQPTSQLDESGDDGLGTVVLGYTCTNSAMTLACGASHHVGSTSPFSVETTVDADLAKTVVQVNAEPDKPIVITKFVSYHTSTGVPCEELTERCVRTIQRAHETGVDVLLDEQRAELDAFWAAADIEIDGDDSAQQAIRWNLFQLAQASRRTQEQGIAAKGVTAGGYDGHYFWDTEVYVVPFLAYTDPVAARKLLRFRWSMLDAARRRARIMSEAGALYPWRTINGEEASAYYAAGTAQYHINAAVVFALARYLDATGDVDFLADEGSEILVETARLWADLGFYANGHGNTFHIHRVTGPDEYTTVVNDNCYTNIMARFNLRYAARTVRFLAQWNPTAFESLQRRTELELDELDAWDAAADAMYIPFDEEREVHPQDTAFLDLEPWDWEGTPAEKYPLLLNFHPLVIYRHQVLKQADVVLAMYLRSDHFSDEQKLRNFDFYDPITTGDSSLSACVQGIVAAQVGHDDLAFDYFRRALYLDLCDLHANTADGVHIASSGGVWAGIVHGFAGMVETGKALKFAPRLPESWTATRFTITRHGSTMRVELTADGAELTVLDGPGVPIVDGDEHLVVTPDAPYRVASVRR